MITHIAIVLDRSGSMGNMAVEAAEAVNGFVGSLNELEGKKAVTINQFGDKFSTTCKNTTPSNVPKLIAGKNYVPQGMTALYDAIGKTITELGKKKRVVMCILTDGDENSSQDYTYEAVTTLIDQKTKGGWKFEFLASNIKSVINTGLSLGIHTTSYADTKVGYTHRSATMTQTVSDYITKNGG